MAEEKAKFDVNPIDAVEIPSDIGFAGEEQKDIDSADEGGEPEQKEKEDVLNLSKY